MVRAVLNSNPVRVMNNLQGIGKGDSVLSPPSLPLLKFNVIYYLSDENIYVLNSLRCESAKKCCVSSHRVSFANCKIPVGNCKVSSLVLSVWMHR